MKIRSTWGGLAVALVLTFTTSTGLFAQSAETTSSSYEFRFPAFAGLSAVKDGRTFRALDFFVNPEFQSDLLSVPATKITFDKYVQDKTVGFSLLGISILGMAATVGYDLATANNRTDTSNALVYTGAALSILTELVAFPFIASASDNFLQTVQTYNKTVQTR